MFVKSQQAGCASSVQKFRPECWNKKLFKIWLFSLENKMFPDERGAPLSKDNPNFIQVSNTIQTRLHFKGQFITFFVKATVSQDGYFFGKYNQNQYFLCMRW